MKRTLLLITIVLFLLPGVFSIRLTPPALEFAYEPGVKHTVTFNVNDLKNNGVQVETGGDFSRSIKLLSDPSTCKESCGLEFEITVPEFPSNAPGKKEAYISFSEVPPSAYGRPAVFAVGKIRAPMIIYAPYPNKYVVVEVGTQDNKRRFQLGETAYFIARVNSHGKETINSLKGNIEIKSEKGELITTVPLTTKTNLPYGETVDLYAEWQTNPTFARGVYFYNAIVDYDGNTASHSRALELGDQVIEVRKFEPDQFTANTINRLEITLYNSWSSNTPASVKAVLNSKSGQVLTTSSSSTIEVPTGNIARVPLFLDLGSVSPGEYDLNFTTQFNEGKTYSQQYSVIVNSDSSTIKEPQQNSAPNLPLQEKEGSLFLPVILTIIILIALALLILIIIKKKKKGTTQKDEL